MEFTIYSIGSSTFLTEVLNGVAMIFNTGNQYQVAGIGMLLFALWAAVQKSLKPEQPMPWSQVLVGYLMFMIFFATPTTAKVEDVYTGRVAVVDNVPLGPVATGSILSKLGYWATRTMEQGFSTTNADDRFTTSGFTDPLQTLVALRRSDVMNTATEAVDGTLGGRSKETLMNYLRFCTMRKPNVDGSKAFDDIYMGALPEALLFDNQFYTTPVITSSGSQDKSCTDAQVDVRRIFQRLRLPEVQRSVTAVLANGVQETTVLPVNKITDLDSFLANIPNLQAGIASDLMTAQVVRPLVEAAQVGYLRDGYDYTAAAALNASFQNRNAQWAAEGSSFLSTVRPMLAYIEGLFYAITPIASIMIVMGAVGIGLVGKYVAFAFWTQLWMPMLAVANLFIVSSTREQLAAIAATSDTYTEGSIYAFSQMSQVAENWLGTASMMVGATPLLALFVVTGSIYTLNSVAGRMSAADTFDEGRVTSKLGDAPAMINQDALTSATQMGGTVTSGANTRMPSLQASDMSTRARSESLSDVHGASAQLGQTVSNLSQNGSTRQQMGQVMQSAMSSKSFNQSEGVQAAEGAVQQASQSLGLTQESSQRLSDQLVTSAIMNGGLNAGAKAGPVQGSVGASGAISSSEGLQTTDGRTVSWSEAFNVLDDQKFSESEEVSFAESSASSIQQAYQESDTQSWSDQDSTGLTSALNEVDSSTKQYSDTNARTQQIGTNVSTPVNVAAQSINDSPEASGALDQIWKKAVANNPDLEMDQNMRYEQMSRYMESDNADVGSKLLALNSERGFSEGSDYGVGDVSADLYGSGLADTIFGGAAQPMLQTTPSEPTGSILDRADNSIALDTARTLPGASNVGLREGVDRNISSREGSVREADPHSGFERASGNLKGDQYNKSADNLADHRQTVLDEMKGPTEYPGDPNNAAQLATGNLSKGMDNLNAGWQGFVGGEMYETAGKQMVAETQGKNPQELLQELRGKQGDGVQDQVATFINGGMNAGQQYFETEGSFSEQIKEANPQFAQEMQNMPFLENAELGARVGIEQMARTYDVAETKDAETMANDVSKNISNPTVQNLALSYMNEEYGFSDTFQNNRNVLPVDQAEEAVKSKLREASPNSTPEQINQDFDKVKTAVVNGVNNQSPESLGSANSVMNITDSIIHDREQAQKATGSSEPVAEPLKR